MLVQISFNTSQIQSILQSDTFGARPRKVLQWIIQLQPLPLRVNNVDTQYKENKVKTIILEVSFFERDHLVLSCVNYKLWQEVTKQTQFASKKMYIKKTYLIFCYGVRDSYENINKFTSNI